MAGRKVGEIYGEIKLKNQQFNTKLAQSQARMKAFKNAAKIAFTAMAVAAAAATAAVIKMTKDTIRYANEVRKAALATGVAVEQFQELAYAAKQEHADIGALEKGLGNLTIRLSYAGDGLETYLRYFRALGIEYRNQDGTLRDTIDVFYEIADKAHKGALSTEELAAITQLFGARAGRVLIPMLKKGSEWFKIMAQEARNVGEVIVEDDIEAIKAFDDKMVALKTTVQGLVRQFVIGLIPALDTFAGSAKESAEQTENLRKQVKEMGYRVGLIFGVLADAVRVLGIFMSKTWATMAEGLSKLLIGMKYLPGIGDELQHVGEQMHQMAIEFYNQALALEEQGSWIQRIKNWYNDAEDAIGDFGDEGKEALDELKGKLGEVREATTDLLKLFPEWTPAIIDPIIRTDEKLFNARESLIQIGGQFLDTMLEGTMSFASIADAVGGLIKGLIVAIAKAFILKAVLSAMGLGGFGFGFKEGGYVPAGAMQAGGYVPAALLGGKSLPVVSQGWVSQPSVIAGEGRGGELIIPEDKLRDMVQITIHNANPHTYVDTLINLPQGEKQRLYRRAIRPAADREGNR